jgi:hypothetical protein
LSGFAWGDDAFFCCFSYAVTVFQQLLALLWFVLNIGLNCNLFVYINSEVESLYFSLSLACTIVCCVPVPSLCFC